MTTAALTLGARLRADAARLAAETQIGFDEAARALARLAQARLGLSSAQRIAREAEPVPASGMTDYAADVDRLVGARNSEAGEESAALGTLEHFATYEEFKLAAERAFLTAKLKQHDWNVAETARAIDMPRSNLYKKLERHGLAREPG